MVHHVRVGQTPDSLEAREMINERACDLVFGFERENDGGEEIANFPSNLYGPNDGS